MGGGEWNSTEGRENKAKEKFRVPADSSVVE